MSTEPWVNPLSDQSSLSCVSWGTEVSTIDSGNDSRYSTMHGNTAAMPMPMAPLFSGTGGWVTLDGIEDQMLERTGKYAYKTMQGYVRSMQVSSWGVILFDMRFHFQGSLAHRRMQHTGDGDFRRDCWSKRALQVQCKADLVVYVRLWMGMGWSHGV